MWKRTMTLTILVAASVGCFEIQGKHTLYLAPDGTVTWTVLEEEIRFDAETREARKDQEEIFLRSVLAGTHDAAASLAALHPSTLRSRILREETPQAILTEARFPGIDRVYQNLFDLYGALATAELEVEADHTRLQITIWPDDDDEDESSEDDGVEGVSDAIVLAVLFECRIVLTEGKFVDAVGFKILHDGRAVEFADDAYDNDKNSNEPMVLSLTWVPEDESAEAR
jgi:hypothetical protein